MALPTRRPERRAITASAAPYNKRAAGLASSTISSSWQETALSFYDVIGELHYACQFIARQMSRVGTSRPRSRRTGNWTEIEEGLPVDLLNRIQDPGGGRSRAPVRLRPADDDDRGGHPVRGRRGGREPSRGGSCGRRRSRFTTTGRGTSACRLQPAVLRSAPVRDRLPDVDFRIRATRTRPTPPCARFSTSRRSW